MEREERQKNVTIAEVARAAGVSSATVSYVLSGRTDIKVAEATREKVLSVCRELGYRKGAGRGRAAKGVTIDDIAREAGVSTATVSYIVNGRTDVKIGEETRRKVLQICNLRQYTPSSVARQLAGKKSGLVGICVPESGCALQNAHYFSLLHALQNALREAGYGVLLFPAGEEGRTKEMPEGILCIDLTQEEFYSLKESCFVPIVAVGMIVDDPLFFKAFVDHAALIAAAKERLRCKTLTYAAYPYRNAPYLDDLRAAMNGDTLFLVHSLSELQEYVKAHPEEHYLFADRALAEACAPLLDAKQYCSPVYSEGEEGIFLSLREMAEHAVRMLESAIFREEDAPHTFRLAPQGRSARA